ALNDIVMITVSHSRLVTVNSASPYTTPFRSGGYYIQPTIGTPSAAGTYTISAAATGFTSATSSTATVTAPNLYVNLWSTVVGLGERKANCQNSRPPPAPAGGLSVTNKSCHPS